MDFFGKPFWFILVALAVTFGLSVIVFETPGAAILLLVIMIGVFILTWKRLEYGLVAVFAELFGNSHGHLLDADFLGFSFSLRMGIFAAVMVAYLVRLVAQRDRLPQRSDVRWYPFFGILIVVAYGFLNGLRTHSVAAVFDDSNAYLYLLYILPILSVAWNGQTRQLLLQTLAAGAVWASILTLGLLFIFTHIPREAIENIYKFIRDTRTGELTPFPSGFYRIFLQAQFSAVVAWIIAVLFSWTKSEDGQKLFLFTSFVFAGFLTGLSRSFWVGIIAGLIVVISLVLWKQASSWRETGKTIIRHTLSVVTAIIFAAAVIFFPLPESRVSFDVLLDDLFSRTDLEDAAVASRWKLLPPLLEEIKEQPVFGKGFGEEVQFVTDDPRLRAIVPDGVWSTYAFEWGWLEVWLKMGVFGLAAFGWLFVATWRGLFPHVSGRDSWIAAAGIGCLVFVFATHFFTPYLNHPLGLGLLLLLVPFWKPKTPAVGTAEAFESVKRPTVQPSVAPLTSE